MSDLLMTYTVLDSAYEKGKLRRIEGTGGSPDNVGNPADTGYGLDPKADSDPMVYSYIGADGTARILLVRVNATDPSATTYTVLRPVVGSPWGTPIVQGVTFTLNGAAVLGNPQGLAQVNLGTNGRFIYLVEYDSATVYGIDVAALEGLSDNASYGIQISVDMAATTSTGYTSHGVSIIALQENSTSHSLFGLYMTVDNPWSNNPTYQPSTLVKLSVNETTGDLTRGNNVAVGRNATGLVPVTPEEGTIYLLVPAIGGKQQAGANNGDLSDLYVVPTTLNGVPTTLTGAKEALLGAPSSDPMVPEDTFDIRMVAASADGSVIYVFTGSFNGSYDMYWRLYKLEMSDLLGEDPVYLTEIEDKAVDSSSAIGTGYYWSVLYENSAGNDGRLWFLKGSPIQITVGTSYPTSIPPIPLVNYKYFDIGLVDGTIGGVNVNSVDLTGEMVAQARTDKFVSTLLRAYQPPHVVSGAFRSMADFVRYEKIRKLHEERLEKKRGKRKDKQGASKVVSLQPKDITSQPKLTVPKLTVSIDPKVLAAKIDLTVSFDSRDASPKIEVTAAQ